LKTLLKIFFGFDNVVEMRKRGLSMALIVPAIRWGEWMLMGMTASLVVLLKTYNLGDVEIFFILWIGNLVIATAMVKFNDSTDVDVTLMEGLRRLVDAAFQKAWFAGLVIEIIVLIRLIVWDGAGYFIIFFRNRIEALSVKIAVFIIASGFQMAVWCVLYIYGYDNFSSLLKTCLG
jgi:hypothetical protein